MNDSVFSTWTILSFPWIFDYNFFFSLIPAVGGFS